MGNLELVVAIGTWVVTVAGLAGQSWANTRNLAKRQDEVVKRLDQINGRVYQEHGQLNALCAEVHSLPCIRQNIKICPVGVEEAK